MLIYGVRFVILIVYILRYRNICSQRTSFTPRFPIHTFNHTDNMNRPDFLGSGSAVVILNGNHGYIFSGCQFWFGNIVIDNSRAITFSDCLFGNSDPVITVTGNDWGAFFHGNTFFNMPRLNVNIKTRFVDCYTSDGTLVEP